MKAMSKKVFMFLLCLIIIFPISSYSQSMTCPDIIEHWAYNDINEFLSKGLITLYPDGLFRPNEPISRAEFYAMFYKLLDTVKLTGIYADNSSWNNALYYNSYISRLEVAQAIASIIEIDTSTVHNLADIYYDNIDLPKDMKGAIGTVITYELMNGYPDGRFEPYGSMTRAEGVVVLGKMLKSLESVTNIRESGEYTLGNYLGSVIIEAEDVVLKDSQIRGNLIILGNIDMDTTINIIDSNLSSIIVDKDNNETNIVTSGNSIINDVLLFSGATLEEKNFKNGFGNIIIDKTKKDFECILYGDYDKVTIDDKNIELMLKKGSIQELIITENGKYANIRLYSGTEVDTILFDAKAEVKGTGKIYKAIINVNGVKIQQKPKKVVLERGVKADIGENRDRPSPIKDDYTPPPVDPPEDEQPPEDIDAKIVSKVKKDLALVVQNARGRNKTPTIKLPSTDNLGHETTITWKTSNSEFIKVEEDIAIIYRRESESSNHDCESETTEFSIFHSDSDSEECGGSGGNVEIVTLIATIEKGTSRDTKDFEIYIPWGWGKSITIDKEQDSCEDEHNDSEPVGNNIKDLTLYLNQSPLLLTSEDLADFGTTVTNAVYEGVGETPGNVELNIFDDSILEIIPVDVGDVIINAAVENEYGDIDISFEIAVMESVIVDDETAVTEAAKNLNLITYSNGHGPKQVNKIYLPATDCLGYETTIEWESDDEEFIEIHDDQAIINRRGDKTEHGGCDDNHTEILDFSSVELFHEDGEDCGGSSGGAGGKSNKVKITATIYRREERETKDYIITIPWGWGKDITIK